MTAFEPVMPRRTHCKRGHKFTPENTYRPPGDPVRRKCLTCALMREKDRPRPSVTVTCPCGATRSILRNGHRARIARVGEERALLCRACVTRLSQPKVLPAVHCKFCHRELDPAVALRSHKGGFMCPQVEWNECSDISFAEPEPERKAA